MRALGPRNGDLGLGTEAREPEAAGALRPRCLVRSGSARCSGRLEVTNGRAIRDRECLLLNARKSASDC